MKKSLIAAAITGALAVPGAVMAQPNVYGKVNLGLLSQNDDAAPAGEEGEVALADGASRLGFTGEEDLGNGLTAIYTYELGVDATQMLVSNDGDRLSFVGLRGDFGTITAGRQWTGFYNHVGSIADLGDIIAAVPGGGALDSYVSRASNWVEYNSAGGPFEFALAGDFTEDADDETLDRVAVSGKFNAGPVDISVGNVSSSAATGPEPTLTGVGVTGSAGNLSYGGSYLMEDTDTTAGGEPTALDVYVMSDFGGGVSGFLGFSQFDNDQDNDEGNFTSIWGHVDRALSSRTRLYAEFQSDSIDGGANPDTDPQQIVVGINHDF